MPEKLSPCPTCGREPNTSTIRIYDKKTERSHVSHRVYCNHGRPIRTDYWPFAEDAAIDWNENVSQGGGE